MADARDWLPATHVIVRAHTVACLLLQAGDRLIASINFDSDAVTSAVGLSSVVGGIPLGYVSGDLVFTANEWNGKKNAGEFGITGTGFSIASSGTSLSLAGRARHSFNSLRNTHHTATLHRTIPHRTTPHYTRIAVEEDINGNR